MQTSACQTAECDQIVVYVPDDGRGPSVRVYVPGELGAAPHLGATPSAGGRPVTVYLTCVNGHKHRYTFKRP